MRFVSLLFIVVNLSTFIIVSQNVDYLQRILFLVSLLK